MSELARDDTRLIDAMESYLLLYELQFSLEQLSPSVLNSKKMRRTMDKLHSTIISATGVLNSDDDLMERTQRVRTDMDKIDDRSNEDILNDADQLIEDVLNTIIDKEIEGELFRDIMITAAQLDNAIKSTPPSSVVDTLDRDLSVHMALKNGYSLIQAITGTEREDGGGLNDVERMISELRRISHSIRSQVEENMHGDWDIFRDLVNDYRQVEELEDAIDSPAIIVDTNYDNNVEQLSEVAAQIMKLLPQVSDEYHHQLTELLQLIQSMNDNSVEGDMSSSLILDQRIPEELRDVDQKGLAISIINRIEDAVASGRITLDRYDRGAMRIVAANIETDANKNTINEVVAYFMTGEYEVLRDYFRDMIEAKSINVSNLNELSGAISEFIISQYSYLENDSETRTRYHNQLLTEYFHHPDMLQGFTCPGILHDDALQLLDIVMDPELIESGSEDEVKKEAEIILRNMRPYSLWLNRIVNELLNSEVTINRITANTLAYIYNTWSWNWVYRLNTDSLRNQLQLSVSTSIPSRLRYRVDEFVDALYQYLSIPDGIEAKKILGSLRQFDDLPLAEIISETRRYILSNPDYYYLERDPRTLNYYLAKSIEANYDGNDEEDTDTLIEYIATIVNWDTVDDNTDLEQVIRGGFDRFGVPYTDAQVKEVLDYFEPDGKKYNDFLLVFNKVYQYLRGSYRGKEIINPFNKRLEALLISHYPYLTRNSPTYLRLMRRVTEDVGLYGYKAPHRSIYDRKDSIPRRKSPVHYDKYEWTTPPSSDEEFEIMVHVLDVIGFNLL